MKCRTADFYYTVASVLVFFLSADHEDSPIVRTCMVRLYPNTVFLAVSNYHINFILVCRVENVFVLPYKVLFIQGNS
ncbi:Uncharacterised protein [Cedecea neteri]|uniref:Uncharacterized protein n=1 Tax=Cedecea neteri TaxID=158822 RepID=A0A2X3IZN5_9ENTR|nr:Uncharacterised protein [Cedecea neteri]